MSPSRRQRRLPGPRAALALCAALLILLALGGCSDDTTSEADDFDDLTTAQRVYDETGDSLTTAEISDLQQRLDLLASGTGADVIVYVRELDADPDDTLDQVEALQQAWVAAAGVDQDTAGAILINREPGTDDEARAGVFVGTTYDDGNVPRDEQEAIVEDALVPPLRDGDVAGSLTAGIERLDDDIRNGPPSSDLDDLAGGAGSTWLPWVGLVLALLALGGVTLVFSRRPRPSLAKPAPTTARPDGETTPALATALVHGSPQASTIPSVIVDLAARDALVIEQEKEPGRLSKGTVRIRLLDRSLVRGDVEQAVWQALEGAGDDGLLDSKALGTVARKPGSVTAVVTGQLRERDWLGAGATRARLALVAIALVALVVTGGAITVASAGAPLMLVAAIPAGAASLAALFAAIAYPSLSTAGLNAARPWTAYRDGLKETGKDEHAPLDLDAALPDVVALGLGRDLQDRLEAATDVTSGSTLRAFTPPTGDYLAANPASFSWGAFAGVFAASSGGSAAVSGGGAGGGGGAAGGT